MLWPIGGYCFMITRDGHFRSFFFLLSLQFSDFHHTNVCMRSLVSCKKSKSLSTQSQPTVMIIMNVTCA